MKTDIVPLKWVFDTLGACTAPEHLRKVEHVHVSWHPPSSVGPKFENDRIVENGSGQNCINMFGLLVYDRTERPNHKPAIFRDPLHMVHFLGKSEQDPKQWVVKHCNPKPQPAPRYFGARGRRARAAAEAELRRIEDEAEQKAADAKLRAELRAELGAEYEAMLKAAIATAVVELEAKYAPMLAPLPPPQPVPVSEPEPEPEPEPLEQRKKSRFIRRR
ncbi:MAG: hypothetical protein ABIH03_08835 [Pseudomonadota bacterium]